MEIFNKLLGEYSFLIEFIALVIYVVFGFILFVKTKNIKIFKEALDTMKKFMYRTEQTAFDESQASNGQVFSEYKSEYRLNKTTDELEKQDELINVQELINSAVDVALDRVLDKFLPPEDALNGEIVELNSLEDKLDVMCNAISVAEQYRDEFNLSRDLSTNDIYSYVKQKAKTLKSQILDAQQKRAEIENIKKEVKNNEKEIEQESK